MAGEVTESRELLSRHVCEATYHGVRSGNEALLRVHPPRPTKQWADFAIDKYILHEHLGEHGDGKVETFAFVPSECSDAAVLAVFSQLVSNDRVTIAWNHEYVTRIELDGSTRKFPERQILRLEKLGTAAAFDDNPVHAPVHYAQEVNGALIGGQHAG